MKFEATGDPNRPFKVTFENKEIDVVKAAIVEHDFLEANTDQLDYAPGYEIDMDHWSNEKRKTLPVFIDNVAHFAQILRELHEHTAEMIVEGVRLRGEHVYTTDEVVYRKLLGKDALTLSELLVRLKLEHDERTILGSSDFEAGLYKLANGSGSTA